MRLGLLLDRLRLLERDVLPLRYTGLRIGLLERERDPLDIFLRPLTGDGERRLLLTLGDLDRVRERAGENIRERFVTDPRGGKRDFTGLLRGDADLDRERLDEDGGDRCRAADDLDPVRLTGLRLFDRDRDGERRKRLRSPTLPEREQDFDRFCTRF